MTSTRTTRLSAAARARDPGIRLRCRPQPHDQYTHDRPGSPGRALSGTPPVILHPPRSGGGGPIPGRRTAWCPPPALSGADDSDDTLLAPEDRPLRIGRRRAGEARAKRDPENFPARWRSCRVQTRSPPSRATCLSWKLPAAAVMVRPATWKRPKAGARPGRAGPRGGIS